MNVLPETIVVETSQVGAGVAQVEMTGSPPMVLRLEPIEIGGLDHGGINNNNLPKDTDDAEAHAKDYVTEVDRTNLHRYIDLISYPVVMTYDLSEAEVGILIAAGHISTISMRRTRLYEEELQEIEAKLQLQWIDGLYFIRLDRCSTKDGNPKAPLMSPRDVVNSLITSNRAVTALQFGNRRIYFTKFDLNWDEHREVRVFVRSGQVTCISQYNPYAVGFFHRLSAQQLHQITIHIQQQVLHLMASVAPTIGTNDFTADFYIEDSFHPRLVELNSFGYWLASGSALFNWNTDRSALYGDGTIHFRFLVDTPNTPTPYRS